MRRATPIHFSTRAISLRPPYSGLSVGTNSLTRQTHYSQIDAANTAGTKGRRETGMEAVPEGEGWREGLRRSWSLPPSLSASTSPSFPSYTTGHYSSMHTKYKNLSDFANHVSNLTCRLYHLIKYNTTQLNNFIFTIAT